MSVKHTACSSSQGSRSPCACARYEPATDRHLLLSTVTCCNQVHGMTWQHNVTCYCHLLQPHAEYDIAAQRHLLLSSVAATCTVRHCSTTSPVTVICCHHVHNMKLQHTVTCYCHLLQPCARYEIATHRHLLLSSVICCNQVHDMTL